MPVGHDTPSDETCPSGVRPSLALPARGTAILSSPVSGEAGWGLVENEGTGYLVKTMLLLLFGIGVRESVQEENQMRVRFNTKRWWVAVLVLGLQPGCEDGSPAADNGTDPDGDGGLPGDGGSGDTGSNTEPVHQLCGEQDYVDVLGGEYRVHNNVWGRDDTVGRQCIEVQGSGFEVTVSEHGVTENVSSYPFILKGCHFSDDCTVNSGMPIQVSSIRQASFTWDVTVSHVQDTFNAAFESWFHAEGGSNDRPSTEMMIWIWYYGPANPKGTQVGTVDIGGHTWEVWTDNDWARYIAFRIVDKVEHVELDLIPFMNHAISLGSLDATDYLDNLEAGFEIWWLCPGLKTNYFSGHVE